MKRTLLSFFALSFLLSFSFGQSFSDDFESYSVGDYIGQSNQTWTTWSGAVGNAEDAQVTNEQSASGTKSIKFVSTLQNGGPQDVVLPFGSVYTSGSFQLSMNFYIESGHNGYFNLQGQQTVGQLWSLNVFFLEDGTINVTDSNNATLMSGTFNHNEWFNFALDLNLTANSWKVTAAGECLGSFSNPNNRVASLDLFPVNNSSFFVDDVIFDYDVNATIPALDAGIASFNFANVRLTGDNVPLGGTVKNFGTTTINSFEITYSAGAGSMSEQYSGLNILEGEEYGFLLPFSHIVADGDEAVTLTLTSINGESSDDESCNDKLANTIRGITPAANKKVAVEEATGTWCQWCPRGFVFMEYMANAYPDHFVGIAVHASNGAAIDPMEVAEHAAGIRTQPGFVGFPSVIVMRNSVVDPSTMELPALNQLTQPPAAVLTNGAVYDSGTRKLDISVTTEFQTTIGGDYAVAVIITEDGVTGASSLFNQANAYSGGANGPMGGWESLPDPVLASQMVYDQVSRAVLGGYAGQVLPTNGGVINAGESRIVNFSLTLPLDFEKDNLHINSVLIEPSGRINNTIDNTVDEAVANGFTTDVKELIIAEETIVYPNPINDVAHVRLNLDEAANVKIKVINLMGELISSRDYGKQVGDQIFTFDGSNIPEGVYLMQIEVGSEFSTKKITIAH